MTLERVDRFLVENQKYFPEDKLGLFIKPKLLEISEDRFVLIASNSWRSPGAIVVISLLLGFLGFDRFILKQPGLGFCKLLTLGGGGIWYVIDWFLVGKRARELNFNDLMLML